MGFHHVPSEYFWVAVLIGGLFVWLFNAYRLGKLKRPLPWLLGGILLLAAVIFFLLTG